MMSHQEQRQSIEMKVILLPRFLIDSVQDIRPIDRDIKENLRGFNVNYRVSTFCCQYFKIHSNFQEILDTYFKDRRIQYRAPKENYEKKLIRRLISLPQSHYDSVLKKFQFNSERHEAIARMLLIYPLISSESDLVELELFHHFYGLKVSTVNILSQEKPSYRQIILIDPEHITLEKLCELNNFEDVVKDQMKMDQVPQRCYQEYRQFLYENIRGNINHFRQKLTQGDSRERSDWKVKLQFNNQNHEWKVYNLNAEQEKEVTENIESFYAKTNAKIILKNVQSAGQSIDKAKLHEWFCSRSRDDKKQPPFHTLKYLMIKNNQNQAELVDNISLRKQEEKLDTKTDEVISEKNIIQKAIQTHLDAKEHDDVELQNRKCSNLKNKEQEVSTIRNRVAYRETTEEQVNDWMNIQKDHIIDNIHQTFSNHQWKLLQTLLKCKQLIRNVKSLYKNRCLLADVWKQKRAQITLNHIMFRIGEKAFDVLGEECENHPESIRAIEKFKKQITSSNKTIRPRCVQNHLELIFHSPPTTIVTKSKASTENFGSIDNTNNDFGPEDVKTTKGECNSSSCITSKDKLILQILIVFSYRSLVIKTHFFLHFLHRSMLIFQ